MPFAASALLSLTVFTAAYTAALRVKFLVKPDASRGEEAFMALLVFLATLFATESVLGIVHLFTDRVIAGRFLFLATVTGVLLVMVSSLGVIGVPEPARGFRRFLLPGLLLGNVLMAASNLLAYFTSIPSL